MRELRLLPRQRLLASLQKSEPMRTGQPRSPVPHQSPREIEAASSRPPISAGRGSLGRGVASEAFEAAEVMSRPVVIAPVNRGNNLWKTAAAIGIVVDCCDLATLFQRATCHSPPLHRWRISLIKSTPAATIGYVEARTPKAPSRRQPRNSTMTRTSNGGWLRSCIADRDAKRASYRYSPGGRRRSVRSEAVRSNVST